MSNIPRTSADNRSKAQSRARIGGHMHWMEIEERQQLAEELASRGVRLDEGREGWQVGLMLECSLQIETRP